MILKDVNSINSLHFTAPICYPQRVPMECSDAVCHHFTARSANGSSSGSFIIVGRLGGTARIYVKKVRHSTGPGPVNNYRHWWH